MKAIKVNNIGYMPIPKVACTTIKNKLFQVKEERDYNPKLDAGRHIHQYWGKNKEDINDADFKFIVIRDPIKRFLSAYSNRVCHHRELSLEKITRSNPELVENFEIYNPGLGQFIDQFDKYNSVNSIKHHCKPVSEWVDGNISLFDRVYRIEEMELLKKDLSKELGQEINFSREQTGGRKIPVSDLSSNQVEFLMEFYREDYKLLKDYYSHDDFWKSWKNGF